LARQGFKQLSGASFTNVQQGAGPLEPRPLSPADSVESSAISFSQLGSKFTLAVAAGLVAVASIIYFSWWLDAGRVTNPWLLICLALAFFYVSAQVYGACYVYLKMAVPPVRAAVPGHTVDVFVPVYDEPADMVEECLRAAIAMRYPHTTYLIDDRRDPAMKELAEKCGAEYRTRSDNKHAKAGNVNAALQTSNGEYVVVFDVDHVPDVDFLEAVVGQFSDPRVGFVQAAVGFRNQGESWTAQATVEQCEDAYGPASLGMHGCDAAPVWGSHCTFRRAALDSIGGHGIGLAEDLQTSMLLHAAGWKSIFVPALKARGLVPSDFEAVTKQQFKWARGVFEVLFSTWPTLWRRLTPPQNVAYLLRCTYYLIGPLFLVHALLVCALLFFGSELGRQAFTKYLLCSVPLAGAIMLSRRAALSLWNEGGAKVLRWRGYAQAFSLWPIYTAALVASLLRIDVGHIATPKVKSGQTHYRLVTPQIVLLCVLAAAIVFRLAIGSVLYDVLPLSFAVFSIYVQILAIRNAAGAAANA